MNKELIEKIIAYNYNEYGAEYGEALVDLKHENEWLHHIIKEVRAYLKYEIRKSAFEQSYARQLIYEEILEILDKENK